MSFSLDSMTRIAHLARLALDNPEDLRKDLSQIVSMVDQIQAVDTTGISPMSHPFDTGLNQRPDLVTEPNQWPELKALAPKTEAGLFLVPQVME
jgi:aspartyl-tRNA(Asn)/glutamyl-tRNA(Gln) amidotransferase subunit C